MGRFYGWEQTGVRANGLTPADFYDLLSGIWCAETCAPRMRGDWTRENPTLGQCSITAFLMQDIFGGRVYGVPLGDGNFHCFNVVDGAAFDLTSEQFGGRALDYGHAVEQSREVHFAKEEKRRRYEYLRGRLLREYAVRIKHGGSNCCQSVLCACGGGELTEDQWMRLGAGFGGGMGCAEATCGALCAAVMLLGMRDDPDRPARRNARIVHQAFKERCGATICGELKGIGTGKVLCACDDCVRNAVDILENM